MTDRTSSYVADIGYPIGCSPELNPLSARVAFPDGYWHSLKLNAACELGFGYDQR